MNYRLDIEIDQPRKTVVTLMDDPNSMVHWQAELIGYAHLSGKSGYPGAKTALTYQIGKPQFSLVETIVTRNFPEEFSAIYESDGGRNFVQNTFEIIEDGRTRWISDNHFECDGLFMKIMSILMPGAFKKQTKKMMETFKAFAENKGKI